MIELLAALAAALVGVLLDRLADWHAKRQRLSDAVALDRMTRHRDVQAINIRIDQEIARETDLGALVDRL